MFVNPVAVGIDIRGHALTPCMRGGVVMRAGGAVRVHVSLCASVVQRYAVAVHGVLVVRAPDDRHDGCPDRLERYEQHEEQDQDATH